MVENVVHTLFLPQRISRGVLEGALDRPGMYQIARNVVFDRLYQAPEGELNPLDTLLDTDEVLDGAKGRGRTAKSTGDRRVAWELRYREVQVPEISVISTNPPMTAAPWAELLGSLIDQKRKELDGEQPQARWELVAALIEQVDTGAITEISRSGFRGGSAQAALRKAESGTWPETPEGLGQLTTRIGGGVNVVQAKNVVLKVRLAWADVSRSDLVDPNRKHPEYSGEATPMTAYAETRLLRQMPLAFVKERDEVRRLLVDIGRAAASAPKPTVRPIDAFTKEDVRDLLGKHTPEKVAGMLQSTVAEVLAKAELGGTP